MLAGNKIPINNDLEKSGLGNNNKPASKPTIIERYAFFSLIFLLLKLQKIVSTAAQHNKSANKNKYSILKPFEATINAIDDNNKTIIPYLIRMFQKFHVLLYPLKL